MDYLCPDCGYPLASPDDVCQRCALAKAIPPAVPTVPVEREAGRPQERRVLARPPDQSVRRSLRMLLAIGIGLILFLFAVTAVIVWVLFGV